MEERLVDAGRYNIKWYWNGYDSGHIITCEKFRDGTIRYYDPQNGKVITSLEDYLKRENVSMNVTEGIYYLRVDNLRFAVNTATGVVKKSTTKKK